jgi:rhodanese-related sulfurtransferase
MKLNSTAGQVVGIGTLAVLAAVLSAFLHPKRPAWYRVSSPEELRWQITPEKAASLAGEVDVLWVDARSREKFEAGHLPDAILLNASEWGDLMFQHMDRLQDAMGRPVVVYCDTAECGKSTYVAQQLRDLIGLDPVYILKGNWRDIPLGESGVTAP